MKNRSASRFAQWAPAILAVAAAAAYGSSLGGAFVYDDFDSIVDNPHIRRLWPPSEPLSLPVLGTGITVDGRPILSLSFALNHALFGPEPWGYHGVNLAIHICAGLLLFGIVRRTIEYSVFSNRCSVEKREEGERSPGTEYWKPNTEHWQPTALALSIALLWLVHPLHTSAVTYIIQRSESMMGMFYLLAVYCAVRGFAADRGSGFKVQGSGEEMRNSSPSLITDHWSLITGSPRFWYAASLVALALSLGTKISAATAPAVIGLYDVVFVSGSIREALRRRRRYYVALVAVSLWLIWLLLPKADLPSTTPLRYALAQPKAVLHYLRLVFWPHPLLMHYGWPSPQDLREILPSSTVLGVLLITALAGLLRGRWYGFAGAWFFLTLSPTSSIVPLHQTVGEHRMYLPLAAVIAVAVVLLDRLCAGLPGRPPPERRLTADHTQNAARQTVGHASRRDHGSPLERRPTAEQPRPGGVLPGRGISHPAAIACLAAAVCALGYMTCVRNLDYHSRMRLWSQNLEHDPASFAAHVGLGCALDDAGRPREAIAHYGAAARLAPAYARTYYNWGNSLMSLEDYPAAEQHYRRAIRLKPQLTMAHNNLGVALKRQGRLDEAEASFRGAVAIDSRHVSALNNLGIVLHAQGRTSEAVTVLRNAVAIAPGHAAARSNLGVALAALGRFDDAIAEFRAVLKIDPRNVKTRADLARAVQARGQETTAP